MPTFPAVSARRSFDGHSALRRQLRALAVALVAGAGVASASAGVVVVAFDPLVGPLSPNAVYSGQAVATFPDSCFARTPDVFFRPDACVPQIVSAYVDFAHVEVPGATQRFSFTFAPGAVEFAYIEPLPGGVRALQTDESLPRLVSYDLPGATASAARATYFGRLALDFLAEASFVEGSDFLSAVSIGAQLVTCDIESTARCVTTGGSSNIATATFATREGALALPEPTSGALAGIGGLLALWFGVRRRRRALAVPRRRED